MVRSQLNEAFWGFLDHHVAVIQEGNDTMAPSLIVHSMREFDGAAC